MSIARSNSLGRLTTTVSNIGQLAGMRNRIINGDTRINQRGIGSVSIADYIIDRWRTGDQTGASVSGKITSNQVTDAPAGFASSMLFTVTSQYAPAAVDAFNVQQRIEGSNIVDLAYGTAGALTITLSNYIKGSVPGVYAVQLFNTLSTRSFIGTVNVTASWTRVSITVTGDSAAAFTTSSGIGLIVNFDLGSGSNFVNTSGSWLAGNFITTSGAVKFCNQVAGSTLNITGVQLELGSVATPFEQRPYGLELSLCQRYFEKSYDITTPPGTANVQVGAVAFFPKAATFCEGNSAIAYRVSKRTGATVTIYSVAGNIGKYSIQSSGLEVVAGAVGIYSGPGHFQLYNTAGTWTASAETIFHWTASAEL